MSMSFRYTKYFNHNKIYNILSSITNKESDNRKTVCNPTLNVNSPTQHGSHICTQVGWVHDGYLLCPSTHLSLVIDLMAEEPNIWKTVTEKTHSYHTGKEEFIDRPTRVHQSTERIYNCPAPTRKKLVTVKLRNIHACEILLLTLL
jgi:hypothetical protein